MRFKVTALKITAATDVVLDHVTAIVGSSSKVVPQLACF